jgi:hypothetical protein
MYERLSLILTTLEKKVGEYPSRATTLHLAGVVCTVNNRGESGYV